MPAGVTQAVDIKKIEIWDKVTPLYTEGTFAGKPVSREGNSPFEFMYREAIDGTTFHDGPTEWATFLPGVYNADTLGIRPDLISRPITKWGDLLSDEFKGKAAIQNIPTIGIMDAIMACESAGFVKYGDKGNPTKDELDKTIAKLIELKKAGHWRALWNTFDESVNLMASGEVVIQSMWSPAVTAVRTQGINCVYQPLKEGYRGWGNGLALMSHLEGIKLDAAYEYLNWYISGWVGGFIAKQGYYISVPETAKNFLNENEWGFFYEGKPATADITSPTGEKTNRAGDDPRRRLLRGALLQGRRVEQPHGRGRVPVRQVERVQRRLIARALWRLTLQRGRREPRRPRSIDPWRIAATMKKNSPARHLSPGRHRSSWSSSSSSSSRWRWSWRSASSATRCWSGRCPTSPSRTTSTS